MFRINSSSRRAGAAIAGVVATMLLLAGCAGAPSTEGTSDTPKSGGTLVAALTGEPDTLDPATSSIYTGAQVYEGIFSKLIDMAPDGSIVGDLATKWEQVDEKTWTFTLAEGVEFQNGEPFSADDVVYTFNRILDPKTASAYAGLYSAIDSVEAVDPQTVTFHLNAPSGPFLTNLAANGQIVNKKAIESDDAARHPVGTGPFEFVEWVQGDHITVKKFEKYFKSDLPKLDQVTYRFLLVDQSRIDALSANEIQWVDAIPLQQVATLSKDPRFTYVTNPVAGIPDFLAMNTTKPPFDNAKVRQAISLVIDRAQIKDVAYFGTGEEGWSEMPSGSPWFESGLETTPEIEKAKQLLADAGYADGLTVEYLGLPQYPELLKTGELVREQLKQIGIDLKIKPVDVSVWFDAFSSGDYQITSAYQERTIDPDNFYSLVIKSGGPINTTGYSNAEVDKLIDEAAQLTDVEKRKALYSEIRAKVTEDAPIVFTHFETMNYLMQKNVVGSEVTPTLSLHMERIGLSG